MTADPKPPPEIIPPEPTNGDASASATANAGAHLRMPHFIDQARDWRSLIAAPLGGVAAFLRRMVNGLVYRLTLTALLLTAIGVTGFGIWQARHMSLPQFDSFWHSIKPNEKPPETSTDINVNDMAVMTAPAPQDETGFRASGDLAALQNQLAALQNKPQDAPASASSPSPSSAPSRAPFETPDAPVNAAQTLAPASQSLSELTLALNKERAAHEVTQARLADALARLTNLTAERGLAETGLAARAAMGELLLRLESGAAYDDLLEDGVLAAVLRRSEMALLALYADSGIPTRAALLARFEIWLENAVPASNAAPNAAPQIGTKSGFYDVVLTWLRRRSDGLVRVTQEPLAMARDDIQRIATALSRGRHDEAAWRMGALLRRLDGTIELEAQAEAGTAHALTHPDRAVLQALYDDVGAAAELGPMLARLRDDYMAGVRP